MTRSFSIAAAALLVVTALLGLNPSPAQHNGAGLGDVVYSVLPPDLFSAAHVHDGQWALLAGQPLDPTSDLNSFLVENGRPDLLGTEDNMKLPDARGVFVRGMNLERDAATGDPDRDRAVGSYQGDMLGNHNHTYNEDGDRARGSGTSNRRYNSPIHRNYRSATSGATGGPETRPRNVTLYTYVKIRR